MNITVKIIKVTHIEKEGNLKAFVDFSLNSSEFYAWRIIQQPDQKAWVSPPQQEWKDKDGTKKYKALIKFPPDLMKAVSEKLLSAYDEEVKQ